MTDDYLNTIQGISQKFNFTIRTSDITNWLNNFPKEDWNKALTVLNKVEYFSNIDIIREFDLLFEKLICEIETHNKNQNISNILTFLATSRLFKVLGLEKRIILHPIGEFAKSGSAMFYSLKQTAAFKKYKKYFRIIESPTELEKHLKKNSVIVLIDDILGSGKSLIKYYNKNLLQILVKPKFKQVSVNVLCLFYMQQAFTNINKVYPNFKIHGNLRIPAFAKTGSVFGYRPKMLEIREFCYKYGTGLYKSFDREKNKMIDHPLGHNNSQALIVFAHSTPNNSIPILWSSKKWRPIFERFGEDKMAKSKKLRFETRKWISMLKPLGFENILDDNNNAYSEVNVQQLMLLRLKKIEKNNTSICQFLNIGERDLSSLLATGLKNGLYNKDYTVSDFGNRVYSDLRKKENIIESKKIETNLNGSKLENIYYIPSMFRGIK